MRDDVHAEARASTSLTVSDTPSTAMLPLAAMKRARSGGDGDHDPVRARLRRDGHHAPLPVHVAGDEVPAQFVADPQRALQVHPAAHGPAAEPGLRQRLAGHVHREPVRPDLDRRQAAAGAGDRGAERDAGRVRPGCRNDQPHVLPGAEWRKAADCAECGDDPGEHQALA